MFTPVLTINATQFQRVYVCNASQQIHLPTLHNRVSFICCVPSPLLQTRFLKYYYPCIMFHSPHHNACDCLEPVLSVVFLRTLSLPSKCLSYVYTCGCVCLDIIPVSFVLVSFSVKLSFGEIQTSLCIPLQYNIYCIIRGNDNDFLYL
jgi:hypothetical protein